MLLECSGEDEGGESDEYASLSDGMVSWEVDRSCGGEGESRGGCEDMMRQGRPPD